MVVIMKSTISWDLILCSLVDVYHISEEYTASNVFSLLLAYLLALTSIPEDRGSIFLQKVVNYCYAILCYIPEDSTLHALS
jgi:hypothetical protein